MSQKKLIISLIILFIVLAVYLNRSYAHIYNFIGQKDLTSPTQEQHYNFGSAQSTSTITYIALGDSLTAGVGTTDYKKTYPYLFAANVAENNPTSAVSFFNFAQPGARTSDVLQKQISTVTGKHPDIITLCIGVNDIHGNISAKIFEKNIKEILFNLKNTGAKIIVVNIPFIGSPQLILPPYNTYFDLKTRQFNHILKTITEQKQISYVDIYSPTKKLLNASGYSADLFHPNESIYLTWSQIIYANSN